jgi:hypothetical protein
VQTPRPRRNFVSFRAGSLASDWMVSVGSAEIYSRACWTLPTKGNLFCVIKSAESLVELNRTTGDLYRCSPVLRFVACAMRTNEAGGELCAQRTLR